MPPPPSYCDTLFFVGLPRRRSLWLNGKRDDSIIAYHKHSNGIRPSIIFHKTNTYSKLSETNNNHYLFISNKSLFAFDTKVVTKPNQITNPKN